MRRRVGDRLETINEALGTDRRVVILGIARMAEAFGNSFLLVVLPLYIASGQVTGVTFGLSEELLIGVVLALTGLLASLGQPVMGFISDRIERRTIFIVAGLAIIALTDLVYIVAGLYFTLILVRIVQGVGTMLTVPTTIALINEYSEPGTRGENMGVYTTLRLIGTGLGPVFAGLIVDGGPYSLPSVGTISGFEMAFIVAAVGTAASALLVAAYVFDPPEVGYDFEGKRPTFGVRGTRALRDPVFHVSIGAFVFGVNLALVLAIQVQINEHLGQGATMFGIQLVAFGLPIFLFGPLTGAISDRIGRRGFLLTGIILLAPTTLAQGLVTTPEGMLLARVGAGCAAALAFAPAVALVGDVATEGDSGTKLSLLTMSLGVGTGLSPIIAGYLIGFGYLVPFVFGTVLAAFVSILAVIVLPETLDEDERQPLGIGWGAE